MPRHHAASSSEPSGFVCCHASVPAAGGQRLEVVYARRRGVGMVFMCAGSISGQLTVPQAWTDRGKPPLAHPAVG